MRSPDGAAAESDRSGPGAVLASRGLSLRWRLILLVVAGVIPLLVFILGYQYVEYLRDVDTTGLRTLALARSMALLVDEELQSRIAALQELATSRTLLEPDLASFRMKAEAVIAQQFPGANILLVRQDGQQVFNTLVPAGAPLAVRADMESTRRMFITGRPGVSDLFQGAVRSRAVVAIDVPVVGADGKVVYALSLNPVLDGFADVIRREQLPATWLTGVLDRNGVAVARVPNGALYVGQEAAPVALAHLLTEREGVIESVSREGVPILAVFSHGDRFGWAVAIGVPRAEFTGPALSRALRTLAAGGLLLGSGLVFALYAARRIAGPIESLQRLAAANDGSATLHPVPSGLREVDEVALALCAAEEGRRRSRHAEAILRAAREVAEQALGKSEERFRLVVDTVPNAIVAFDADGIIELVNVQAEQIFGYPRAELQGRGIEILLAERLWADHPELRKAFFASRLSRPVGAGRELYGRRRDGQEFPIEVGMSPMDTADGTKALVSIVDMTARRQAERTQAYYAAIVESSADAIIAKDLNGAVTSWNKSAELMFGWSASEMIGEPIIRLIPADRIDEEAVILAKIRQGERIDHFETQRRRKDGVEFPASLTLSPIRGLGGDIIGASKIVRDITEQIRMGENLRTSEDRFRSIFSAVGDGIFILSPSNGAFIEINEAGCVMFGYASDELIGRDLKTLSSGIVPYTQQEAAKRVESTTTSGQPQRFAWHCRAKDGHLFWAEISLRSALIGGQTAVLAIMRDVTEQRAADAQLRQAQKMEAIGNLSGGMAHDFNNMLGVIIGNLDLAGPLIKDNHDVAELVEEAIDAALSSAELTRRLLAFARKQSLRAERIAPNDLISGIVRLLRRTLGENIEIVLDLADDLWPVIADSAQLEASLTNLATNARDAMPNGGRLSIATVNRRLDADYAAANAEATAGDYAAIEVSDTGTGMAPDIAQHIFEPFYTTKDPGRGTGLGLSMVFGFIKQSGGHINVYSEPGVGTTFRLYLPRVSAETVRSAESQFAPPVRGAGESVLAVEDNPRLRQVVMRQLSELGYRPIEADGPAAALAILEREKIDLLFTDIMMPGPLDGIGLARQVLKRWPTVKVALTSGFAGSKFDGLVDARGAAVCLISKPYRVEELAEVLRKAFDG